MFTNKARKKATATWVGCAFLCLVFFSAAPAGAESKRPASGMAASMGGDTPRSLEKEAPKPSARKKNIVPYVLAGVAAITWTLVLVTLLNKKKTTPTPPPPPPPPVTEQLHDDFTTAANANWTPRRATKWSVSGGYYKCHATMTTDPKSYWEWSLYKHAWSKANYTVQVRMKVSLDKAGYGLMLSNTADMSNANVYQFFFLGDGRYKVRKIIGFDLYTGHNTGFITTFRDWTAGGAKATDWNAFKIAKSGGNYVLAVNGSTKFTFSDQAFDPRYVSLFAYSELEVVQLDVDSVYIDLTN